MAYPIPWLTNYKKCINEDMRDPLPYVDEIY